MQTLRNEFKADGKKKCTVETRTIVKNQDVKICTPMMAKVCPDSPCEACPVFCQPLKQIWCEDDFKVISFHYLGNGHGFLSLLHHCSFWIASTVPFKIKHPVHHIRTLISLIDVAQRLFFLGKYSRPYAVHAVIKDPTIICFEKNHWKNWVKIEKRGFFSKTSLYGVTKISGPPLVPDPSFIRFWHFFQTLRLFATLR